MGTRQEEEEEEEGGRLGWEKACCFISPWGGDTMDKVKLLKTRRSWKSAMVRNCDKSHNFRLPRVHVLFASIQKLSSAPSCCYSNHIYSCCSTFITEPKPESVSQHCWSLIYRVLSVIICPNIVIDYIKKGIEIYYYHVGPSHNVALKTHL